MWKRTRAIRKDITQQHLNCRTTAEVLEIVARYHIWCAHALAKEDRSVFSAKINNENLEKTMTSIEQNYQGIKSYSWTIVVALICNTFSTKEIDIDLVYFMETKSSKKYFKNPIWQRYRA